MSVAPDRNFSGFLVGMAISGLAFGVYAAVDLALVVGWLTSKAEHIEGRTVFASSHLDEGDGAGRRAVAAAGAVGEADRANAPAAFPTLLA